MMLFRSLIFWLGLIALLPQALWLRHRAPRFAEAAGQPAGEFEGPDPVRLVAIGDSIIAGVGCRTLEQACVGQTARCLADHLGRGVRWISLGRSGATTGRILRDLVPQLPDPPIDYIVISTGVNDITSLKTLAQWRARLTALMAALKVQAPGARIAMIGVPPLGYFPRLPQPLRALFGLRAKAFDLAASRLFAPLEQAVYVPFEGSLRPDQFAADGYHPSEESCREIAELVVKALHRSVVPNPSDYRSWPGAR